MCILEAVNPIVFIPKATCKTPPIYVFELTCNSFKILVELYSTFDCVDNDAIDALFCKMRNDLPDFPNTRFVLSGSNTIFMSCNDGVYMQMTLDCCIALSTIRSREATFVVEVVPIKIDIDY